MENNVSLYVFQKAFYNELSIFETEAVNFVWLL